jgi:hypothetical protein
MFRPAPQPRPIVPNDIAVISGALAMLAGTIAAAFVLVPWVLA